MDNPISDDAVYTMCQIGDADVSALYQLNEEQMTQQIPSHWRSYISVSNIDATVEKAKSLGATIISEPSDVFDAGRMAALLDPTGAEFRLWQPKQHIGAKKVNEAGAFCWNELYTNDTKAAGDFYTSLLGWGKNEMDTGSMVYTSFLVGEQQNGGMLKITEEMGNILPNWLVYFTVPSCEDSVKQAETLNGTILLPPTDIPDVGRFAVIQDPEGAVFAAIALNNPG